MADDYLLTGPAGTVLNLGSWLQADPGPDFGIKGLVQDIYSSNPKAEGGVLAYEQVGVRRFVFPLLLPSGAAGGVALSSLEGLLRALAQPGAFVDLKPAGVATADMVRFDILTGRYVDSYNVRHHAVNRRLAQLELDVQPYGYLPTWILLASAASVGLPGTLALPGGSVIGDVPGLLRLNVQPSSPANSTLAGTWLIDMLAFSVGGRASFSSRLLGGSWTSGLPTSALNARSEAFAATVLTLFHSPTFVGGWTTIAYYDIPAAVEPGYRGRFRAMLLARQDLNLRGDFNAIQLSLDAVPALNPSGPMASAQAIATLAAQPASVYAPNVLDLGEITLPPQASGINLGVRLRLWAQKGTYAATSQSFLDVDTLCLLPADQAGYLPRALAWPRDTQATMGRLAIDSYAKTVLVSVATGDLATTLPILDALQFYRGGFPKVGASTLQVDLVAAARRKANLYQQTVLADSPIAYYRLDDVSGAATLTDISGNARHGTYVNAPSLSQPGLTGEASSRSGYFDGTPEFAGVGSGQIGLAATSFTIEAWTKRMAASRADLFIGQSGAAGATFNSLGIGYLADNTFTFAFLYHDLSAATHFDVGETHHWVCRYDAASKLREIFKDGRLVASGVASPFQGAGPFMLGRAPTAWYSNASIGFQGLLDEVAVYNKALPSANILAHYLAGAAGDLPARPAQSYAALSAHYRPRFTFLKAGV